MGKEIRRRAICAQIQIYTELFFYLFEAERRPRTPTKKNPSEHQEALSILLIYSNRWSYLTDNTLDQILTETVKRAAWPTEESFSELVKDITVHQRGVQSTDEIAQRIIEMIERNF